MERSSSCRSVARWTAACPKLIQCRIVVRGQGVVHHGEDLTEANHKYAALIAQANLALDPSETQSVTLFKNYVSSGNGVAPLSQDCSRPPAQDRVAADGEPRALEIPRHRSNQPVSVRSSRAAPRAECFNCLVVGQKTGFLSFVLYRREPPFSI